MELNRIAEFKELNKEFLRNLEFNNEFDVKQFKRVLIEMISSIDSSNANHYIGVKSEVLNFIINYQRIIIYHFDINDSFSITSLNESEFLNGVVSGSLEIWRLISIDLFKNDFQFQVEDLDRIISDFCPDSRPWQAI